MGRHCINPKFERLIRQKIGSSLSIGAINAVSMETNLSGRTILTYLRTGKSIPVETRLARFFRISKATFRHSIGLPKRKVDSLGRKYVAKKPRKPVQKRRGRK